jgi:hypothetical protein
VREISFAVSVSFNEPNVVLVRRFFSELLTSGARVVDATGASRDHRARSTVLFPLDTRLTSRLQTFKIL